MFQRIKHAFCRLLGVKTRPYLRPLPEGPIIESLTPSTMLHRRKPEQVRLPSIRDVSPRSEPVYERTWPDPFREQRPTRYDPAPRPTLRLVDIQSDATPANPPAPPSTTPMEIVFAAGVLGAAIGAMASNDAPTLPEPAPEPEAEVFTPQVFEDESSSSSSDDSSSSSSD